MVTFMYETLKINSVTNTALLCTLAILIVAASYAGSRVAGQTSSESRCLEAVCHVQITKDGFVPRRLIIQGDATVVWTNLDEARHTVTSGSPGDIREPFKSSLLSKGDSYSYTFTFAPSAVSGGSFKYFDQVTKTFRGEIILVKAGEVVEEQPSEIQGIKIDYTDPLSGIKKFSLTSGRITFAELFLDDSRLRISVEDVTLLSKLDITLDRNLMDSKVNGTDTPFRVLIDGKEGFYEEISSLRNERTFQIVVPAKTKLIEIIGTQASADILGLIRARIAIVEADDLISFYNSSGIMVTQAASRLVEAEDAFEGGRYSRAETLALEATSIANSINHTATLANRALTEAKSTINEIGDQGFDVSAAIELLAQAEESYVSGNYNGSLSLAEQAKTAGLNAVILKRENGTDGAVGIIETITDNDSNADSDRGQDSLTMGVIATSVIGAAAAGAVFYARSQRRAAAQRKIEAMRARTAAEEKARVIDVDRIFADKPNIRYDDRDVIKYIAEKGGEVLESEIRDKFELPRTTAWRLVKRLGSEEIVEITKVGMQNLIRIRDEFTKKEEG